MNGIDKNNMDNFEALPKFDDFLKQQLNDPEVKSEYEALEPEFSIMQVIVEARAKTGLTQKQLAEKTGISQADISRLERGTGNPSVKTLQRIASALGRKIQIEFV